MLESHIPSYILYSEIDAVIRLLHWFLCTLSTETNAYISNRFDNEIAASIRTSIFAVIGMGMPMGDSSGCYCPHALALSSQLSSHKGINSSALWCLHAMSGPPLIALPSRITSAPPMRHAACHGLRRGQIVPQKYTICAESNHVQVKIVPKQRFQLYYARKAAVSRLCT